jgi:hypothetical protein
MSRRQYAGFWSAVATSLWIFCAMKESKAPSPLRSAGALHVLLPRGSHSIQNKPDRFKQQLRLVVLDVMTAARGDDVPAIP